MTESARFRASKDHFFAVDPRPLTPDPRRTFKGLHYVPGNPVLALEVVVPLYAQATGNDLVTIQSNYHYSTTLNKLQHAMKNDGLVFATIVAAWRRVSESPWRAHFPHLGIG